MPRTSEQNQAIKDKRRSRIIKSAIKVFAELGYDNVAVDDITKVANCSHGLFYHYFENLDTILQAIVDEYIREEDLFLPCHTALAEGGVKGLKTLLGHLDKSYVGTSIRVSAGYLAVTLPAIESLPKSLKKVAAENNIPETLAKLIEQGQKEKKVIAGDPAEIARGINYILVDNFKNVFIRGKNAPIVSSDVMINMLLLGERED